jgi:hypothetical protein
MEQYVAVFFFLAGLYLSIILGVAIMSENARQGTQTTTSFKY